MELKKLPTPESIQKNLEKQDMPQIRTTPYGIEIKRKGSDTWIIYVLIEEAFNNFINRRHLN